MEVATGVHKVDGTWGGNVYLLEDGEKLALVDAALPGNTGKILRHIKHLGRDPSQLHYIILTHAHPDHTGTIPALLKRAELRVAVHRRDTRMERDGRARLFYHGQPVALPWSVPFFGKIYAHELAEEGHVLPVLGGLRVLHTPGHTPGSIALFQEERRLLFTGDTLLSDGKRFSRPIPFPGFDPKAYRRSVERLAQLDFDLACVGHGRPLIGGATGKLHEMLENYFWAGPWFALLRKMLPKR